ncbi:jg11117 [Pararge aegeria aegeria]|uniref:Jg11117 protein n=1 Tax=Pararge aegeria aegeria TaxID=348720 RepID=A0A8S4RIA3_9NEOP|nr:jg11117 [Pararge aegeria aegeria]
MDSLVGYGSDDDGECGRYGYQPSGGGDSGARRREDDTNYDDVNMDMSEWHELLAAGWSITMFCYCAKSFNNLKTVALFYLILNLYSEHQNPDLYTFNCNQNSLPGNVSKEHSKQINLCDVAPAGDTHDDDEEAEAADEHVVHEDDGLVAAVGQERRALGGRAVARRQRRVGLGGAPELRLEVLQIGGHVHVYLANNRYQ